MPAGADFLQNFVVSEGLADHSVSSVTTSITPDVASILFPSEVQMRIGDGDFGHHDAYVIDAGCVYPRPACASGACI